MRGRAYLGLFAGLFALSCYSAGDIDSDGETTGGSAGSSGGGTTSKGGTTGKGGVTGRGGTTGNGGSGGSSGSDCGDFAPCAGAGGCRDVADCGSSSGGFFECVPPGATPAQSSSCGAPQWCGQCSCGPQPLTPYGTGNVCDEVTPCPTAESDPGIESYASVCDLNGQCTACTIDDECPAETPRCAVGQTGFGNQCFECIEDTDCPELTPRCVPLEAAFQTYTPGGACRECVAQTDCATGICVAGACQPQCATAEDCNNDFLTCSAELRCAPAPCATAAECAEFGACLDGGCVRMSCGSDLDCEGGICVNGGCYPGVGSCVEHFAAP